MPFVKLHFPLPQSVAHKTFSQEIPEYPEGQVHVPLLAQVPPFKQAFGHAFFSHKVPENPDLQTQVSSQLQLRVPAASQDLVQTLQLHFEPVNPALQVHPPLQSCTPFAPQDDSWQSQLVPL